jgi:hypothetical protein
MTMNLPTKMRFLLLASAVLASPIRSGHGAEAINPELVPEASKLVELWAASIQNATSWTGQDRHTLAVAFSAYCTAVLAVIPRNSPQEADWLHGELSANGERAGRAVQSQEFARSELLDAFDRCSTASQQIVTASSPAAETGPWISLAAAFNDDDALWERAATIGLRGRQAEKGAIQRSDQYAIGFLNTFRWVALVAALRSIDHP